MEINNNVPSERFVCYEEIQPGHVYFECKRKSYYLCGQISPSGLTVDLTKILIDIADGNRFADLNRLPSSDPELIDVTHMVEMRFTGP